MAIGIFHRVATNGKLYFYPIEDNLKQDWAEHARLNPGTILITSPDGAVLWKEEGGKA